MAVCSWSLQPARPADLVAKLESKGIRRVQLALDPLRDTSEVWGTTAALFQPQGIRIVSGMLGCVGEDYSLRRHPRAGFLLREVGGQVGVASWLKAARC